MLTIDVNLLNNPVLITCPTQRVPSEKREYDHLTGYVLLRSDRRRCIGAVRVVWAVTVEQARFVGAMAGSKGGTGIGRMPEQAEAEDAGEGADGSEKIGGFWLGRDVRGR